MLAVLYWKKILLSATAPWGLCSLIASLKQSMNGGQQQHQCIPPKGGIFFNELETNELKKALMLREEKKKRNAVGATLRMLHLSLLRSSQGMTTMDGCYRMKQPSTDLNIS